MFNRSLKIIEHLKNLKEKFTQNGKGFHKPKKEENFFEKFQEEKKHLKEDIDKYNHSTYPNTYVWVEKFREEYKPYHEDYKQKKKAKKGKK